MSDSERLSLVESLRSNILLLKYYKKDGSLREAYATTNSSVIKRHKAEPKSEQKRLGEDFITYYDLDRRDWRCFNIHRLVSWDRPED